MKYGLYREDLKIVSDYDFFFKNIIINKVSTTHIPIVIAVFDLSGMSSIVSNRSLIKSERRRVQLQYVDEKVVDSIQRQIDEEERKHQSPDLIKRIVQRFKRHK
jgi:hypothetical protein